MGDGHERGWRTEGKEWKQRHRTNGSERDRTRRMKSERLANGAVIKRVKTKGGRLSERTRDRKREREREKEAEMKRERSNLVEEDCFHSVLKLKRNEDRRPRFESRLSAGDNQTEGDLFSLSLSLPSLAFFPPTPLPNFLLR